MKTNFNFILDLEIMRSSLRVLSDTCFLGNGSCCGRGTERCTGSGKGDGCGTDLTFEFCGSGDL